MAETRIIEGAEDSVIAGWLRDALASALARTAGEIAITVPGGSTPFPILATLAGSDLDWARIAVWPGDDRIVAEDHPTSNVGRIRALLAPAGARIVALSEDRAPPPFALAWLGMGCDGHVASLFPSSDPRADDPLPLRRIVPDPLPPEAPFARLSLTIPALARCDAMVFVIRGAEKRAVFEAAARVAKDLPAAGRDLPVARLLAATRSPVTCFV